MTDAAFEDEDRVWVIPGACRKFRKKAAFDSQWDAETATEGAVSRRTIQFMESDSTQRAFKYETVAAAAAAYGVSPSDMIDWDKTRRPISPDTSVPHHDAMALDELRDKLSAATKEPSPLKARQVLGEVAHDADKLLRATRKTMVARLRSDALRRLAELETNYQRRLEYRRAAIETVAKSYEESGDWLDLLSQGNRSVDYFYDQFGSQGTKWIRTWLRKAADLIYNKVDSIVKLTDDDNRHATVLLLAQRSSLLRCLAQCESNQEARKNRFAEMVRCADKARRTDVNNPIGHLEFGQAVWHNAFQGSREECEQSLTIAEQSLDRAVEIGLNLGHLVQARFYRQTYRPVEAIESFRTFANGEPDRRRVLAESHIVGEAAFQCWRRFDESALSDIDFARNLLNEAVEAGYAEARKIVALALLQAILDGADSGTVVLTRLSTSTVSVDLDRT